MKPLQLLSYLFISFTLIAGCIDLSDSDKEELKSFLDGYAEEENEEVSLSDARDKDYLGNTDVSIEDTSGNARIGGEVAVSSLEDNATQANSLGLNGLSSRAQGREADVLTSGNFTVSFINGSGQKETISSGSYTVLIHYPSDGGDPQFIIEGLGDGINYIVEVAVTVDGEDLNLKSVAFVPPGATKSEKAVIDPISTVVAEAVQEKVTSGFFATGGEKFSQDYISDLNETMTAVIEEVIENNPEISITNFEVAITSNTGIDNLVSKLLADEEVNASIDKLEDVAVEEKFEAPDISTVDLSAPAGDETDPDLTVAREYVGRLFAELFGGDKENGEGGGGAPKIFVDFFGDKFEEGATKTVQQIFDALALGLTPDVGATPFTAQEQTAALAQFKSDFAGIYSAFDAVDTLSQQDTLSAAQETQLMQARETLKDIPQMLMAIFPPDARSTLANYSTSSTFDVPQAITMIFYVLDVYLNDDGGDNSAGGNDDGDDFDPFELLVLYDFDSETDGAAYGGVEINWLGVHPGRMWVDNGNGTGSEIDVLNAFTCVEDFLVGENFVVDSVTLTFPTSTGTSTKTLVDESTYHGGDGGECFVWDTWQEQRQLEESGTYGDINSENFDWNGITAALISANKIISDFTSGDYVVTVNYTSSEGSDSISRTFPKKIITGLQQLNPRLTTPASQPRHPEGNVSEAEWQAYWAAQQGFTPTTFPAGAIGTIQWNAPEGLADAVPEGVIAAYSIDIGRNTDCDQNGHCNGWENIFNTWEDNIQIFDTQFELPQEAKDQLVALELSDNNLYNINLGITFLDAQTGEYLGNGGWSHAQFRVGEAIELTDEFTLTGSIANVPNNDMQDENGTAYPASAYKVALVKESCDHSPTGEGGCTQTTIENATIDGTTYSLTTTFGDVKFSDGSWVNLFMYIDANGDGEYTQGTEANNFMWEPQFWSMNHVNFNTWGGVLRLGRNNCDHSTGMCEYTEEAVVPDGEYAGPDFDTMPEEINEGTASPQ